MKKFLSVFLIVAIAFTCTACSGGGKQRFTATFLDLFDTASTVVAYDTDQASFDEHYNAFHKELQRYDRLFDIYHEYDGINNLCYVNKNAAKNPVKVDAEIIELLQNGKIVYNLSKEKTNICMGSVLSIWHDARTRANDDPSSEYVPDIEVLRDADEHTDINDLVIDKKESTVFFKDPEMSLDVGAIAKGFAVDKVVLYAKENLWKSATINIGGNVSAYGYKNNDGKTLWNVGIEDPRGSSSDYLLKVAVTDKSVVTSGDYQRFFTVNGKKYSHIINVGTLMPSDYYSGVTVICDNSSLGDALSTTLFNMNFEEGKALVESISDVDAVWIDKDNNVTYSSGFGDYIVP